MSFFKSEDFECHDNDPNSLAKTSNSKLAREGKVVYAKVVRFDFAQWKVDSEDCTHKALLINIEPLEMCAHPKDKVKSYLNTEALYKSGNLDLHAYMNFYQCECGTRVEPTSFKECE